VYQMMRPTTSVATRTPPTTPPAIAPVLELFLFELELGLVEELDPDVDDVDADVDGVPSGESPALCAAEAFQVSATDTSRYAQWGTRVPSGIALGYVPAEDTVLQLKRHWDHCIHEEDPWQAPQALTSE